MVCATLQQLASDPPGIDGAPHLPLHVIEPPRRWEPVNWSELWRYRELLYFLTWRDVKIRYKQTFLGVAWAVLQPLLTMLVFTIFFGRLAGLQAYTGGVPYPIYVYAALLPWTFFASAVTTCGASVISSSQLITKVYFPRLIIPLAAVGAALVDFLLAFIVLLGMMAYYGTPLSWKLALLPLLGMGVFLAAAGVGALFAALTVAYRDFRYVVPFVVQLWMFLSGIMYPPSIVPPRWRALFFANPLAGLVDGFRSALLDRPLEWGHLAYAVAAAAALFVIGASYFRAVERRFADII